MASDPRSRSTGTPAIVPDPHADDTLGLLRSAREGNHAALDQFAARYLKRLRRFAHGRLPSHARTMADTEDVVQDVLLNAVKQVPRFEIRGPGSIFAYLRTAVLNRVQIYRRTHARRPSVADGSLDRLEAQEPSPLDAAIGADLEERYRRALGRLSLIDRTMLVMRIEKGDDYATIAATLRKPSIAATRVAIQRAVVRLAREMQRE